MKFTRRIGKGLLKCLGPILFLFLVLKVVDPKKAWELLRGLRWDLCALSLVFFPWVIGVHALRWWMIARLVGMKSGLKRLFQVYYVGWFLGFLPPGGVAVMAKVFYLRRDGEPAGRTSVSLGVDKLFDLVSTAIFGSYGLLYFQESLFQGYGTWLGLMGGAVVFTGLLWKGKWIWERAIEGLMRYVSKFRGRIKDVLLESDRAAQALWKGMGLGVFLKLMLLSICLDLSRPMVLFLLARAMGLGITLPFAFACRALIGLVQVIPVTIGGLGTREAVLVLTFPLAGFSPEAAVALGFLLFLWNIIFHFSGVVFWLNDPVSYRASFGKPEELGVSAERGKT